MNDNAYLLVDKLHAIEKSIILETREEERFRLEQQAKSLKAMIAEKTGTTIEAACAVDGPRIESGIEIIIEKLQAIDTFLIRLDERVKIILERLR